VGKLACRAINLGYNVVDEKIKNITLQVRKL